MISKDKKFYKTILAIAIPIAIQNFISFMVNLIDTLMIGKLGEVSLSGTNLAGQMFFIMMVMVAGVSEGSNVLIAQFYGKNDVVSIRKIYSIAYRVATFIGIIAFIIAFFFPKQFMRIYSNESDVIIEGAKYLKIMAIGYIPYAVTAMSVTTLRAVHSTKIAIVVYGSSFFVNFTLNYLLIYGSFGFPKLGVQGAAIATVVSRFIELAIILIYISKFDEKIKLKLKHLKNIDKDIFKNFIKNSIPILFNEICWVLGSTSISIIFGRLGKEVVSANVISSVTFQLVSILLFGTASAALVTIGNVIGEGNIKKAYEYSQTFIIISIFIGIIAMTVVFFVKDYIISFYNITDKTILIAQHILSANAIILFFQSITIVGGMGVLRGGGDSKYVLWCEVIFLWIIAVPLGVLAAFYFKFPIFYVYLITKIDEIFKTIFFCGRIFFSNFVRDMTVSSEVTQDFKNE